MSGTQKLLVNVLCKQINSRGSTNALDGCFHRTLSKSRDVAVSTWSCGVANFLSGDKETFKQWILDDYGNLLDNGGHFSSDDYEKAEEFVTSTHWNKSWDENPKWNDMDQTEIVCYVDGNGFTNGTIPYGKQDFLNNKIFQPLRDNQKLLAIIDANYASKWIDDNLPSNVSVIGSDFTTDMIDPARKQQLINQGRTTDDEIQDWIDDDRSLLQWALDRSLRMSSSQSAANADSNATQNNITWIDHLQKIWYNDIEWRTQAHQNEAQLVLHNMDHWAQLFPQFFSSFGVNIPSTAIASYESTNTILCKGMAAIDILEVIPHCNDKNELYHIAHISKSHLDDTKVFKLAHEIQKPIPDMSAFDAVAVARYVLHTKCDMYMTMDHFPYVKRTKEEENV